MAQQWFKFYGAEYLSDPKIERLSPVERSCWLTILCMASMTTDGIIEFLTVESLLNRSGIQFDPYHPEEWEKALSVLVKFKNLKMIDTNDEGQIIVKNWSKRQEHNLTVAERVAKSRRNRVDVTSNVTNVTTEENRIEENRDISQKSEIPISLNNKKSMKMNIYDEDRMSDDGDRVISYENDADGEVASRASSKVNTASPELTKQANQLLTRYLELYGKYINTEKPVPIFNKKVYLKLVNPYLKNKDLGLKRMLELVEAYIASDDIIYHNNAWSITCFLSSKTLHKLNAATSK